MSYPRYFHASCSFKQRVIYLFGGHVGDGGCAESIDMIDLEAKDGKWSLLELA